jgi:orotate phosphoribosyltransferase
MQKKEIIENLLEINAIKINFKDPFIWTNGWYSPIYCDMRKTLSYPKLRDFIKHYFAETIKNNYSIKHINSIAGVATGAIPIATLTADLLDLPFIYVRSLAKEHGLKNLIEGNYNQNDNIILIEDTISTGNSTVKAAKTLKDNGCNVIGIISIFDYEFQTAIHNINQLNVPINPPLLNFTTLINALIEKNIITPKQLNIINKWHKNPTEL